MSFEKIAEWILFAVVFGSMLIHSIRGLVVYAKLLREMPEDDEQHEFISGIVRGRIFMTVMLIIGAILSAKILMES